MNEYDVKRLALILQVQAEIEGMKAENKASEMAKVAPKYRGSIFFEKASELQNLAYCPNDAL